MNNTKRVLVIGNGFDLAHGLKTKYMDFFRSVPLKDNIWYKYFDNLIKNKDLIGNCWIDFEAEISIVISALDKGSTNLEQVIGTIEIDNIGIRKKLAANLFGLKVISERAKSGSIEVEYATLFETRAQLFMDLEHLIISLENYLVNQVDNLAIQKSNLISELCPSIVVNFNYTHTFTKNYGNTADVFFVHGECGRGAAENNMVLGIEDYWTGEEKNTHTNYAIFKKYIQRMQRGTYRALKESYSKIKQLLPNTEVSCRAGNNSTALYFYGHSLSITDKDILVNLLQMNFGKTIVYYYSKTDEGQYMSNMVVILGKSEFENRMMENRLEFRQIPKEVTETADNPKN